MSSKDPTVSSGGNETRSSILPKVDAEGDAGFMLPGYDFQAAVPGPASIGVRRDNSLGSVVDAAKGVAYYVDMIGFGEASNPLSRGAAQPVKLVQRVLLVIQVKLVQRVKRGQPVIKEK